MSVLGLALVYAAGSFVAKPKRTSVDSLGAGEERFTLITKDEVKLAASYFPGPQPTAPGIVLLHGIQSNRGQFKDEIRWLTKAGFAVLALDFRGHGESDPKDRSFGLYEACDAHAAINWLRAKQQGAKVGVIGFSLGGASALLGEDGPVKADALVLNAVYPDIRAAIYNRIAIRAGDAVATVAEPLLSYQSYLRYGLHPDALSPANALSSYAAPVFLIGGGADSYTPPAEVSAMSKKAQRLDSLWIIPGQEHAALQSQYAPEYQARIEAFFGRHLQ
jgi:uncharacterized protein